MSIYEEGLAPTKVNHVPLTPLNFIKRTAAVYPHYPSVVHGSLRYTWADTSARCRRLASALRGRGISQGDTVAVRLPNIPAVVEPPLGVAVLGAVLNRLNVRLDADTVAYMLEHSETKILIADREYGAVVTEALTLLENPPLLVELDDPEYGEGEAISELEYEALLAEGDPEFEWLWPNDEWKAISLNYTSG